MSLVFNHRFFHRIHRFITSFNLDFPWDFPWFSPHFPTDFALQKSPAASATACRSRRTAGGLASGGEGHAAGMSTEPRWPKCGLGEWDL